MISSFFFRFASVSFDGFFTSSTTGSGSGSTSTGVSTLEPSGASASCFIFYLCYSAWALYLWNFSCSLSFSICWVCLFSCILFSSCLRYRRCLTRIELGSTFFHRTGFAFFTGLNPRSCFAVTHELKGIVPCLCVKHIPLRFLNLTELIRPVT